MEHQQLRVQGMRKPCGRRYRLVRNIGTVRRYEDVLEHEGPSRSADRRMHRLNMVVGLVQVVADEVSRARMQLGCLPFLRLNYARPPSWPPRAASRHRSTCDARTHFSA